MTAADYLTEAWQAEDPAQAAQLFQEAARLADLHSDQETAVYARKGLLRTSNELGDDLTLLTAFSWLLAHADANPESDSTDLLWEYKWALGVAFSLPGIPLTRLHALLDDFARRTRQAGLGERTATTYRWKLALHRGDLEQAEAHRKALKGVRRTWLDCAACNTDLLVSHHLALGDVNAALKAAQPVLKGKQSCNRVPTRTHTDLMLPMWQAGRHAEAQAHHQAAWPELQDALDSLSEQSMHLMYLTLSDQQDAARTVHHQLLPHAQQQTNPGDLYWWHLANALPGAVHDQQTTHLQQARAIAAQFDGRNGTPEFTRKLNEFINLPRV